MSDGFSIQYPEKLFLSWTAPIAAVQWQTPVHPVLCAFLMLSIVLVLWRIQGRMRVRGSLFQTVLLLFPKALVLLLLFIALFDPIYTFEKKRKSPCKVLSLIDISASMEVKDEKKTSRLSRARAFAERLREALSPQIALESMDFNTKIHYPEQSKKKERTMDAGTDLGHCISSLAEKADISSYLGLVIFTDGGDERVENVRLPPVPLFIAGVGTPPALWNDIAVADLHAPLSVEGETQFEVSVDSIARAGGEPSFSKYLAKVNIGLEKEEKEGWKKLEERTLDLSKKKARSKFKIKAEKETGLFRYRVSLQNMQDEVSHLNNARIFRVEVQKKNIHVLYFSQELGADFKMVRNELAADPGIQFTAMFRTIGQRFLLQGKRVEGDESLQTGFPGEAKILKLYHCVLLGSFGASYWNESQMMALKSYVEQGGAVVFLGGENSFGRGKYERTPLAPLFPWQVSDAEEEMLRGEFHVSLSSTAHPIIHGLSETFFQPSVISSINRIGNLRPGAVSLLSGVAGEREIPLVSVQPFGKGYTLGIASNTFWQWGKREGPLKTFHGRFWRQAIRNITGRHETGRLLSVKWDRESYRPGEEACVDVHVGTQAENLQLSGTLFREEKSWPVHFQEQLGDPGHHARILFRERGEYLFRVTACQQENVLETYEKTIDVSPMRSEGSHLEVDAPFLSELAKKGSGMFVAENEIETLAGRILALVPSDRVKVELPMVRTGPYFALLLLFVLTIEWGIRKRMNLI